MAVNVSAKQSLGQHFLRDVNMALKIVDVINPRPQDIMLEIGPGHGILTTLLQPRVKHLYAVEIDQRLYESMYDTFKEVNNFTLIKADFLQLNVTQLGMNSIRVVGNIPYNITSPILFRLFEQRKNIKDVTFLVQKEVGRRIVSSPNSKEYGILAVISQAFADVKLKLSVPPTVFQPQPRVDSALVQWTFTEARSSRIRDEFFFRSIVKKAFGQRRKMLRNSLKSYKDLTTFDFTRRPEQLSVLEWITLSNELSESLKRTTRDQGKVA